MYIITKPRTQILKFFNENKKDQLNANDLFLKLPQINLATIYRNLEYFFSLGILSKTTINDVSYFYLNQSKHNHLLVCLKCQKQININCSDISIDYQNLEKSGFVISSHDLKFYGFCKLCQLSKQIVKS